MPSSTLLERLQRALGTGYAVEGELGGGGMSHVYVVRDEQLGRRVVLKLLHPELAAGVSAARFAREVALLARLQHPHVVPLLSAGAAEGLPYYTMPLVEGETLRARLRRDGTLPIPFAVRLLRELADALSYAHAQGVVHRDLKPENVLLTHGHAVVADFGVAKALGASAHAGRGAGDERHVLTSAGFALGTPAYMAPEQALADPSADHRVDLYALGVIAYEVLAGAPPFGGSSQQTVAAHVTATPRPLAERRPDTPPALAALVMRLLAKDPEQRPRDATETLRALEEASALPSGPQAAIPPTPRDPPARRRAVALGALLATAAALGGTALWERRGTTEVARGSVEARPPTPAPGPPSIAVLPFTNVGGDAANANFGDGLADELIGALGKVRGLKVAGRTSAFALGGRGLGVRAIADTLGVATVLEGSVQRAGGRLRVRAQLVSARDDAVLWSGTYDREPRDVFAVQDEIARAIVGALAPALGGARAPPRPPARDLATYELYLRARHFLNRRTDRDLRRGAEYFEQVIARDSGYAQAYAGLADAYVLMAAFGAGPPRETIPRARAAAATAVRLDPALAEAHAALGNIHHLFDWDWRAADREFAQALALDSSFSMAWAYRGILRVNDGRVDEGLADLSRSRALDPLSPTTLMHIGRAYLLKGRADSAAAHLRAVLELTPELARARQYLGDAYLQQGRVAEAVEAYRSAATRGAPADSARLAYALAVSGRRAEAERLLAALVAPSRRYLSPVPVATAYAALGDADAAFRWLERGLAERAAWMHNIATAPQLDRLHGDPRWARLVSRMGLVR